MADYKKIVGDLHAFVKTNIPASLAHRREQLKKLHEVIVKNQDRLADAVYKDLKREQRTTIFLEITPALTEISYCLQNLEKWAAPEYVEKTIVTALDTPMIIREPFGVNLLIAPWNYPILMNLLPLITILAAGNTVLLKPSELSPATSQVFDDILSESFDKNYIAVVQAGVEGTTELLKQRFDHIFYTGNGTVGRIIMKAAAENLTPLVLELGGKCPAIILSDADIEISARRLVWGKFTNNGQTCLAPDYILVKSDVKQRLITAIQKTIHEFYGTDCHESKDYSRIINQRHFDRLKDLTDRSKGRLLFNFGNPDREDLFIPPHVIEVDSADDSVMKDELFGPILPILTVESLDAAIEFVNEREKPLAMYIFTRNEDAVNDFLKKTRSGAVTVNDVILHINVDSLPFGGIGHSGFGAYHGKFGFEQFSHKRAVLKRGFFGEGLASCRYAPMTDQKFKQLGRLATRRALPEPIQQLLGMWKTALILLALGLVIGRYL